MIIANTKEFVFICEKGQDFESKLGKPIYSFTLYEKVKRATITLESEEHPILMISFDIKADHQHIIMDKILPIIRKEGL